MKNLGQFLLRHNIEFEKFEDTYYFTNSPDILIRNNAPEIKGDRASLFDEKISDGQVLRWLKEDQILANQLKRVYGAGYKMLGSGRSKVGEAIVCLTDGKLAVYHRVVTGNRKISVANIAILKKAVENVNRFAKLVNLKKNEAKKFLTSNFPNENIQDVDEGRVKCSSGEIGVKLTLNRSGRAEIVYEVKPAFKSGTIVPSLNKRLF